MFWHDALTAITAAVKLRTDISVALRVYVSYMKNYGEVMMSWYWSNELLELASRCGSQVALYWFLTTWTDMTHSYGEDGCNKALRNIGILPHQYMTSQPGRQLAFISPWEPENSHIKRAVALLTVIISTKVGGTLIWDSWPLRNRVSAECNAFQIYFC